MNTRSTWSCLIGIKDIYIYIYGFQVWVSILYLINVHSFFLIDMKGLDCTKSFKQGLNCFYENFEHNKFQNKGLFIEK
jgi:hypothetical protein